MSQTDGVLHEIDGETFRVRYLDPLTAHDMLVEIGKTVGPAIGEVGGAVLSGGSSTLSKLLASDDDNEGGDSEGDPLVGGGITKGVRDFFERIDGKKMRWMMEELSKVSEIQKGDNWPALPALFSVTFRGRPGLMYKWLWAALSTNFADFFSSLSPVISRFGLKMAQAQSKSPPT